jgi:hypothetical protein
MVATFELWLQRHDETILSQASKVVPRQTGSQLLVLGANHFSIFFTRKTNQIRHTAKGTMWNGLSIQLISD